MIRLRIAWLWLITWAAVLGLGALIFVAGAVNVALAAAAWPFDRMQVFARTKLKALS